MSVLPVTTLQIDFLKNLKLNTTAAHKNLENLSASVSIISPYLKIPQYIHYLNLMHTVHHEIEQLYFPLLKDIYPDLDKRSKSQLIEKDLLFLNYKPIKTHQIVFKREKFSIPQALGILYVVEGSSLGGRVILKNIESTLHLNENNGASYFAGYGNKTGNYWKFFLDKLVEYEQENHSANQIIESAIYAFDSIYNHFHRNE